MERRRHQHHHAEEIHRVVYQHGTCSEEEREGLLGPEIPVTVCSLLCECHASAQVLDVFAAAACWCNEPSRTRSTRLRSLEQGSPGARCAKCPVQGSLRSPSTCVDRREHGRHEESHSLYVIYKQKSRFFFFFNKIVWFLIPLVLKYNNQQRCK